MKYRESLEPNPYPHKFHVGASIPDFIEKYSKLEPGEKLSQVVTLAGKFKLPQGHRLTVETGRIHNQRASSAKLRFYDLHGDGQKVQIMANAQYFLLLPKKMTIS